MRLETLLPPQRSRIRKTNTRSNRRRSERRVSKSDSISQVNTTRPHVWILDYEPSLTFQFVRKILPIRTGPWLSTSLETALSAKTIFGVVVSQPPRSNGEHPINGFCAACGYQLNGWRLIVGRKRATPVYGRIPNVFG